MEAAFFGNLQDRQNVNISRERERAARGTSDLPQLQNRLPQRVQQELFGEQRACRASVFCDRHSRADVRRLGRLCDSRRRKNRATSKRVISSMLFAPRLVICFCVCYGAVVVSSGRLEYEKTKNTNTHRQKWQRVTKTGMYLAVLRPKTAVVENDFKYTPQDHRDWPNSNHICACGRDILTYTF